MDRREHVPQRQDARLRRRRHRRHAEDRQSRRQMRRSQCALCRPCARRRPARRATSTASASRHRSSATRASAPAPRPSPRRSIAAPRCISTGFGWVPVDPADVRKVVLEEPPANLRLIDAKVAAARKALFGAWEGNWLAYNVAHDIDVAGRERPAARVPDVSAGRRRRMRGSIASIRTASSTRSPPRN